MAVYDLPLEKKAENGSPQSGSSFSLEDLLIQNVAWYIKCRWFVTGMFVFFGACSFIPGLYSSLGLHGRLVWPFFLGIILLCLNVFYIVHHRTADENNRGIRYRVNLWVQILLDLTIVTGTVYFAGSTETNIPFIYLFHIVLACIFLPRSQSLIVTGAAIVLYGTVTSLELTGLIPDLNLYTSSPVNTTRIAVFFNMLSSVMIWGVVWLMASFLSSLVRKREYDLEESNKRLIAVQKEKIQHMLHTTHELKAPFAAIQANTQLLLKGYCGKLEEESKETIERIAVRSARLALAIQEMLQLANLRSESEKPLLRESLHLGSIIKWSVEQVGQVAKERNVNISLNVNDVTVTGVTNHLKMLFVNLISNAVYYSHNGGNVTVSTGMQGSEAFAIISDNGIGIAEDKLQHIFNEYYHTNEALKHNPSSTGLGLAIVRQIAENHRISIRVESKIDEGTVFTLRFKSK